MKFHCLYVSSVSACFELENSAPYYAEQEYDVTVNGAPALMGVRTNVFSLFELKPDTEYTDYQWWLARTENGDWEIVSWGY